MAKKKKPTKEVLAFAAVGFVFQEMVTKGFISAILADKTARAIDKAYTLLLKEGGYSVPATPPAPAPPAPIPTETPANG